MCVAWDWAYLAECGLLALLLAEPLTLADAVVRLA